MDGYIDPKMLYMPADTSGTVGTAATTSETPTSDAPTKNTPTTTVTAVPNPVMDINTDPYGGTAVTTVPNPAMDIDVNLYSATTISSVPNPVVDTEPYSATTVTTEERERESSIFSFGDAAPVGGGLHTMDASLSIYPPPPDPHDPDLAIKEAARPNRVRYK